MQISDGWMVIVKAIIYFLLPIAGEYAALFKLTGNYDYYPKGPIVLATGIIGLYNSLIALKAFLDGSNARYEAKKNGGTVKV